MKAEETHLDFTNQVFESDSISLANNYYFYNGAGISVADFNNDGLQDIYYSGNHTSSKLYLNKGNLNFKDVTSTSKLENNFWSSGSTYADVNGDGKQDIFVCTVGQNEPNLLYINQGNDINGVPIFKEEAARFGVNDIRICTQAAFFDYDQDNDLDLFVIVNSQLMNDRNQTKPRNTNSNSYTVDILYRNNGDETFTDISQEAGIINEGYSLGLAINDINNDGWPDIYVANDFITNDLLYINDKQGGFDEKANDFLRHTSYNGMGVDIADVNNDGYMDITVMDMLPESNRRRKLMMAPVNYDLFNYRTDLGYAKQHVKNTLQINQGTDEDGSFQFSELGTLTGIYSTDWSWAPLWADFDNSGTLDLFITNGYYKDLTDMDFSLGLKEKLRFGSNEYSIKYQQETLEKLNPIKKSNFMYSNQGSLQFKNVTEQWGLAETSFSHGAAFADFDNDGDLDLTVNNLGHTAFFYRNNTIENNIERNERHGNFLSIKLHGTGKNQNAFGARLELFSNGKLKQSYYHSNVRGYLSSMGDNIHFGLGQNQELDSITVRWPDGKYQTVDEITLNTSLTIDYKPNREKGPLIIPNTLFKKVTDTLLLEFEQKENSYIDFKNDPLFYKMYSREGPSISVSDINNDGLDDILIGGSSKSPLTMFSQENGTFKKDSILLEDAVYEDMGILLFDADNDGDNDLYVASGGSDFVVGKKAYQDRFYINENGTFTKQNAGTLNTSSSGPVKGADYDRDGDIDLFVGGKISPGSYPTSPISSLLKNENGILNDVTPSILKEIGMVNDALWTDFNNDGWIDLMVVGEWTKIQLFKNEQGTLAPFNAKGLENSSGWWNSIAGGDFDNDGDTDYILGNFGLNTYIKADSEHPVRVYAADYDANGKIDPIFSYFEKNDQGKLQEFTLHTRDALISQIVAYKKRFKDYKSFSEADFDDVLRKNDRKNDLVLDAKILTSKYIENLGKKGFKIHELPIESQVAPVYGILIKDFDEDGNLDALLSGNQNSADPLFGNYDASNGILLMGNGNGNFKPIPTLNSGLYLNEDQKSIVSFYTNEEPIILAGANQGPLKAYKFKKNSSSSNKLISLKATDAGAFITYENGNRTKMEFYYGNSYLSQSSRKFEITTPMKEVIIYDFNGTTRTIL
ncbi:VCBS repeat-containing protein [Maribacter algicola]|uniref:VCBS repeat-containing protein n=1 Tax=Maribacter algicola TaxID=2498892 RepID=UPI0014034380|nr:VCBS repeat-containing protein [Maribacter algicola]